MSEEGLTMIHGIAPARVRAVVFDLGGVFLEGRVENVIAFGVSIGLTAEIWGNLRNELFLNDGPFDQLERGEMALETFAGILVEKVRAHGIALTLDQARDFMGAPGGDRSRLRTEIVAACREVRAVMPTAMLTNNVAEWREAWHARIAPETLFDVVVDSSEVGMRKPEPGIYRLTEERLGLSGGDLLFIDDLGVNLKAARSLGWQTLKYDDTQKVLQVLDAVAKNSNREISP